MERGAFVGILSYNLLSVGPSLWEGGRCVCMLKTMEMAPLVDGFSGFNLPIARAVKYGCWCLWLSFHARFMSSCLPEFRDGGKEQFHKIITETD